MTLPDSWAPLQRPDTDASHETSIVFESQSMSMSLSTSLSMEGEMCPLVVDKGESHSRRARRRHGPGSGRGLFEREGREGLPSTCGALGMPPQRNLGQMREYWFHNVETEFVALKFDLDAMQRRSRELREGSLPAESRRVVRIGIDMQCTVLEIWEQENRLMWGLSEKRVDGQRIPTREFGAIHCMSCEVGITRDTSDLTLTIIGDSLRLEQTGVSLHSQPTTGVFFTGWKGLRPSTRVEIETVFPTQLVQKVVCVENRRD